MLANSHLVRQTPAFKHLRAWIPTMVEKVRIRRDYAKRSAASQPPPESALLTNISPISLPNVLLILLHPPFRLGLLCLLVCASARRRH
ncbi:hypothetical protein BD310DRAFT_918347, partial [Dichomitus squalens]